MFFSSKTLAVATPLFKIALIVLLVMLATCSGQPDAQTIVDKAIAVHGGSYLEEVAISFKFRTMEYRAVRQGGKFRYERAFEDSAGKSVRDILSNEGLVRLYDKDTLAIDEEMRKRYAASVNSVIYFALLPFGLNDPAVNKTYLGETIIKGQPYYEVKVTFDEEGGGEDFEDVFIYWINQHSYTMDYLAYAYHTEGGGTRFREAINSRHVNRVRFADYINYKYIGDSVALDTYEDLFERGELEELSRILLEDIEVNHQTQ